MKTVEQTYHAQYLQSDQHDKDNEMDFFVLKHEAENRKRNEGSQRAAIEIRRDNIRQDRYAGKLLFLESLWMRGAPRRDKHHGQCGV